MSPRSSIRSMRPVALDSETLSMSARRLIGISPQRWSVYRMLSWAMLRPSRRTRSLEMALSAMIVDRKSAMIGAYGSLPVAGVDRADGVRPPLMVRVT